MKWIKLITAFLYTTLTECHGIGAVKCSSGLTSNIVYQ